MGSKPPRPLAIAGTVIPWDARLIPWSGLTLTDVDGVTHAVVEVKRDTLLISCQPLWGSPAALMRIPRGTPATSPATVDCMACLATVSR